MFSAFRQTGRVFVVDGEHRRNQEYCSDTLCGGRQNSGERQDSASTSARRCSPLRPTSRLGSTGSSCLVTPRPHSDKSLPPCDHANRPGTSCSLIYLTLLSKERERGREGGSQTGGEEDSLSTSERLPDWREVAELI